MHYAMKTYGEVDVYIHILWTSALGAGEWSASHPGRFTFGERIPVPIGKEIRWTEYIFLLHYSCIILQG
jgi:hypothetical protein